MIISASEKRSIGSLALFRRTISARSLVTALFITIAAPHPLLWLFLGSASVPVFATGIILLSLLILLLRQAPGWAGLPDPSLATCILAFSFALALFLLGGEGRLFYANTDWQVRGAVLRDLATYPWPFAYAHETGARLLRAPLGMYMTPAVVGKIMGLRAAEFAVLLQNSMILAIILALGAQLYGKGRERFVALAVIALFSGMDIIGALITRRRLDVHMEHWMHGAQFTAHVTQAFWVPQHALAGWGGALLYLLWRTDRAPLAALLVWIPIASFFSPLSTIGLLPFAAHAGLATLFKGRLGWRDIALPALATATSTVALVYMTSGSGSVGSGLVQIGFLSYFVFIYFEAAMFLLAMWLMRSQRFGMICAALVTITLLAAPFGRIGLSNDFVMRATIPALAILSVIVADLMVLPARDSWWRLARRIAVPVLLVGMVTPASEIIRAVRFPHSPALACSYFGIVPGGAPTYVTPVAAMPKWMISDRLTLITSRDPVHCWDGPWPSGEKLGLFDPIPNVPGTVYVPE